MGGVTANHYICGCSIAVKNKRTTTLKDFVCYNKFTKGEKTFWFEVDYWKRIPPSDPSFATTIPPDFLSYLRTE